MAAKLQNTKPVCAGRICVRCDAPLTGGSNTPTVGQMWLAEEEQIIVKYLQLLRGTGATAREICRKAATKDRWKENERWAIPFISRLKTKGLIATDNGGRYVIVQKGGEKSR